MNERRQVCLWLFTPRTMPGIAGAPDPQNDDGDERLDAIARATDPSLKRRHSDLLWRASSRTGIGWSLHQKFFVIDGPGSGGNRCIKVFMGGLDLTRGRYEVLSYPVDAAGAAACGRRSPLATWCTMIGTTPSSTVASASRRRALLGKTSNLEPSTYRGNPGRITRSSSLVLRRGTLYGNSSVVGNATQPGSSGQAGIDDDAAKNRVLDLFKSLFDRTDLRRPWESFTGPFTARVIRSLEKPHWGPRDKRSRRS